MLVYIPRPVVCAIDVWHRLWRSGCLGKPHKAPVQALS